MNRTNPLTVVRDHWLVVVALTVVGVVAAALVLAMSPALYTSTITLYVASAPGSDDTATNAYQASLLSEDRVKSYKELLGSGQTADAVAERVGGDVTVGDLVDRVAVSNQAETVLLTVTVSDTSPERAALIASTYGQVFGETVTGIERAGDLRRAPSTVVRTAFPATVAFTPVSPRPMFDLTVGLVLGLLAGLGAAFVLERRDDTIRAPGVLARAVGAPDLGPVRRARGRGQAEPVMTAAPASACADDHRRLRAMLRHAARQPGVIMIGSAGGREGTTATAVNLASALADGGDRVLLVDADFVSSSVAEMLDLTPTHGLSSVLDGRASLAVSATPVRAGLDVLVAGATPEDRGDLLASAAMRSLLEAAAAEYTWVLIDTPGVLSVADAAGLAPLCTGVLVVARYGTTSVGNAARVAQILHGVGASVVGTVLTGVPERKLGRIGAEVPAIPTPRPGPAETITPAYDEAVTVPGRPRSFALQIAPSGPNLTGVEANGDH